jgi:hypothetical protein
VKHIKMREFTLDRSLGYLIQNITKDSTQEILGYFHGIAQFVIDDLSKSSKASWFDKNIVLFYKETAISFRIRLRGRGTAYSDREPYIDVDVTYPKETEEFKVTDLMNAVVEAGLGLADDQNLPLFERPELKTPRCLRKVRIAQNEQRDKTSST